MEPARSTHFLGSPTQYNETDLQQNRTTHHFSLIKFISHSIHLITHVVAVIFETIKSFFSFHLNRSLIQRASFTPHHSSSISIKSDLETKFVQGESSVADLMIRFTNAWDSSTARFNYSNIPFNVDQFTELLITHAKQFAKTDLDYQNHFGFIDKFDLSPAEKPQIFVRADLHGDLKSLIENLRSLKEQNLLDENFKCRPGTHLVFLGDYCDRGEYGIPILELLMRLRIENKNQVHLIRGNHEYTSLNVGYNSDPQLNLLLDNENGKLALEKFYETLSLTTYFSLATDGQREYVQCTHGLFELTCDPASLIDHPHPQRYLLVPKQRMLSERINKISNDNSPTSISAKRIKELAERQVHFPSSPLTAYNWADISTTQTHIKSLERRQYRLCAQDIRYYLDLSSEQHRVVMLFRGHQHQFSHLNHENEVIVTTLSVGMDSPPYQHLFNQDDRAYIIKPEAKVANWSKKAILRASYQPVTDEITKSYPLTSQKV